MLSKEDVPHLGTPATEKIRIPYGCAEDFYIKINEISNENEVRSVDISKRSCRFHDENYVDFYPVYSTSACLINCRKKLQLKLCNCTSYLMPNAGRLHRLQGRGNALAQPWDYYILIIHAIKQYKIYKNKLNSVRFL